MIKLDKLIQAVSPGFSRPDGFKLVGLVLAGILLGGLINGFRPEPIPWFRVASGSVYGSAGIDDLIEASAGHQKKIVIIDARALAEYTSGHVAGAINLPNEDRSQALGWLTQNLGPELRLIIYCRSETCEDSLQLADFLAQQGFEAGRISLFHSGWEGVRHNAKIPQRTGSQP
jgi:rhodanese-related sulfurtransferase